MRRIPLRQRAQESLTETGELLLHPRHYIQTSWQGSRHKGWRKIVFGAPKTKALLFVAVVACVSPLFMVNRGYALSVGPNSPTSAVSVANGTSSKWTSPTRVTAQDNSYATVSLSVNSTSYYIQATGYGFSIPANAVINGVSATVYGFATPGSGSGYSEVDDAGIYLLKAGAQAGSNVGIQSTLPSSNAAVGYGGSSNLWGTTLTPSDVNNTGFGFEISYRNNPGTPPGKSYTVSIDYMSLTVYYTIPSFFNQASYRLYNNTPASAGAAGFSTKVDYSVGSNSQGVALADVNGDGIKDIVAANYGSSNVSVLLGNSSGGFAAAVNYATAIGPAAVAVGDINGDGKADIITLGFDSGSLTQNMSLLTGNGDGSFNSHSDYSPPYAGNSIVLADVNGDSKLDAIVAVQNVGVDVFINSGTSIFVTPTAYGNTNSYNATVGDVNNDGKLDIVSANSNAGNTVNSVSVLLGTGTGTFGTNSDYATATKPESVALADFNGDSKLDIVAANNGSTSVSILLNSGTGTFGAKTDYTTGSTPISVTVGDFNGDGINDIATVNNNATGAVSVLAGSGTGTFGAKTDYTTGSTPIAAVSSDLNGDGRSDIVTANNIASGTVSVLLSPLSAVDVGTPLAALNTAATAPGDGQPFRLRMDVGVTNANLASGAQSFKLQFAPMTTSCDTSFTNTPSSAYSDVSSTSTVAYYHNANSASGASLVTNANDPTDSTNTLVRQTYQEKGTTTFANNSAINIGQDGMWDFALTTYQSTQNTHYCIRMVTSGGTPLTTYAVIPEIITPAATFKQAAYRWFNNTNATGASTFALATGGTGAEISASTVQTSDGGYATTGYTNSYGAGSSDMFIAKYTSSGTLSWYRIWGGTGADEGTAIVQTSDGGFAVGGYTASFGAGSDDVLLAKYTSTGTLSWAKTWGGASNDDGSSLVQTSDGGYMISGQTQSYGDTLNGDAFLVKFDSTGAASWSRTWGSTSSYEYCDSVVQTSDGGYAIAGYTASFGAGIDDIFLAKYTSTGTLSWSRTWGGTGNDEAYSMIQTSDGGYAITGYSTSFETAGDVILLKYDSTGTLQWNRSWGSPNYEYGNSVVQTSDGGYAIAGYTASGVSGSGDVLLLRYSSTGTLTWAKNWGGANSDSAYTIALTTDGGYMVGGDTQSYGPGSDDMLLLKYDSTGTIAGCAGSMCQTPTGTAATPTATTTSPTATTSSPSVASATVAGTTASPSPTVTTIVALSAQSSIGSSLTTTANTTATLAAIGTPFRLRAAIAVLGSGISAGSQSFKLQFAPKLGSCSTSVFSDVTSTSTVQWYTNSNISNGSSIGAAPNDPTDGTNGNTYETYQSANPFSNAANALYVGNDGIWDFSLILAAGARPGNICFRIAKSDGTVLNTYSAYPELQFGPTMPTLMRQGKWFDSNGKQQTYFLQKY